MATKCLAKDPDRRWQTARDLLDELKWIGETHSTAPSSTSSRSARWVGQAAAALVLLTVIAAGTVVYFRRPAVDTSVYRSTFVPPATLGGVYALALSPDGHRLAFIAQGANGRTVLWVRPLDSLSAQPLMGTEDAATAFWSPDSRSLAFWQNGKLKRIDASGGPVLTLADSYPSPGSWSRDDVILFTGPFVIGGEAPIVRVAATGGTPTPVTTVDSRGGEALHKYPWFLPDGRHFLFTAATAAEENSLAVVESGSVFVGSLDSKARTRLFQGVTNAQYAHGMLFFGRGTTLMTQPFDLAGLRPSGEPVPLVEQLRTLSSAQPVGAYTVTDTGVLAFQAGIEEKSRLTWFDRGGKEAAVFTGRDRSESMIGKSNPDLSLSPDGRQATIVLSGPDTRPDIWILDLMRGVRTRLTFDPAGASAPVWSPDGRAVIFRSVRNGHQDLYTKPSSGAGSETSILSDRDNKFPESLSPDGRHLLYYRSGAAPNLWVLPLFGDRKPFAFTNRQPNERSQFNERRSQFSSNGRWVAYESTESGLGRWDVYVAPFPAPGGKWQISTAGGREPRWRRDGKELFFLSGNTLMAAAVVSDGDRFDVRDVKPLFEVRPPPRAVNEVYDVSPDGQHFFFNVVEDPQPIDPVTIVVNWPALLKK